MFEIGDQFIGYDGIVHTVYAVSKMAGISCVRSDTGQLVGFAADCDMEDVVVVRRAGSPAGACRAIIDASRNFVAKRIGFAEFKRIVCENS